MIKLPDEIIIKILKDVMDLKKIEVFKHYNDAGCVMIKSFPSDLYKLVQSKFQEIHEIFRIIEELHTSELIFSSDMACYQN